MRRTGSKEKRFDSRVYLVDVGSETESEKKPSSPFPSHLDDPVFPPPLRPLSRPRSTSTSV